MLVLLPLHFLRVIRRWGFSFLDIYLVEQGVCNLERVHSLYLCPQDYLILLSSASSGKLPRQLTQINEFIHCQHHSRVLE